MSQRESGYTRIDRDAYNTPEWVTQALIPHLPRRPRRIWECAVGEGRMAATLHFAGFEVVASDIMYGEDGDFLKKIGAPAPTDAIITNPPYALAVEFIEHALELTFAQEGFVAMLLRVDFDSAATRRILFADCDLFAKKVILVKRIVWFDNGDAAPSFNHAWYIWDWQHKGPPVIAYGPDPEQKLMRWTKAARRSYARSMTTGA